MNNERNLLEKSFYISVITSGLMFAGCTPQQEATKTLVPSPQPTTLVIPTPEIPTPPLPTPIPKPSFTLKEVLDYNNEFIKATAQSIASYPPTPLPFESREAEIFNHLKNATFIARLTYHTPTDDIITQIFNVSVIGNNNNKINFLTVAHALDSFKKSGATKADLKLGKSMNPDHFSREAYFQFSFSDKNFLLDPDYHPDKSEDHDLAVISLEYNPQEIPGLADIIPLTLSKKFNLSTFSGKLMTLIRNPMFENTEATGGYQVTLHPNPITTQSYLNSEGTQVALDMTVAPGNSGTIVVNDVGEPLCVIAKFRASLTPPAQSYAMCQTVRQWILKNNNQP